MNAPGIDGRTCFSAIASRSPSSPASSRCPGGSCSGASSSSSSAAGRPRRRQQLTLTPKFPTPASPAGSLAFDSSSSRRSIAGVMALRGVLWGVVLIIVGLLVGPFGASVFNSEPAEPPFESGSCPPGCAPERRPRRVTRVCAAICRTLCASTFAAATWGDPSVAEIHHFTYGCSTPVAAYLMAFLGSTAGPAVHGPRSPRPHPRPARPLAGAGGDRDRRRRHLADALHGHARLRGAGQPGALRPGPHVREHGTGGSHRRRRRVHRRCAAVGRSARSSSAARSPALGVVAMHYTGMSAMHVAGRITYDPRLVAASGVIAVVAATVALWFTVSIRGWWPILAAAAIMGVAVCGMHYTGMAAMRVRLDDAAHHPGRWDQPVPAHRPHHAAGGRRPDRHGVQRACRR